MKAGPVSYATEQRARFLYQVRRSRYPSRCPGQIAADVAQDMNLTVESAVELVLDRIKNDYVAAANQLTVESVLRNPIRPIMIFVPGAPVKLRQRKPALTVEVTEKSPVARQLFPATDNATQFFDVVDETPLDGTSNNERRTSEPVGAPRVSRFPNSFVSGTH